MSLIDSIYNWIIQKYRYYFKFNKHQKQKYLANRYNLTHSINNSSIVFEVGGYTGVWVKKIIDKYHPNVYVFEPVKEYYNQLKNQLGNNNKVRIYNFGLGGNTRKEKISIGEDGSGLFLDSKNTEEIDIINFKDFLNNENIQNIDLIQINIEGGEYELIEHILENNLQNKIDKLQVQFHRIDQNSEERRASIQKKLKNTHKKIYDFPFLWEAWRKL